MSVYDRWHLTHPDPERDTPCRCSRGKTRLYPSREHGQGDRWQVRWTDDKGKACRANRPRLGDAKGESDPDIYAMAYDAKIHADLNSDSYISPDAGAETFKSYAEDVIAARTLDPGTRYLMRRRLIRHVYPVIGDKELRVLARRPSLVQGLVSRMGEQIGASFVLVVMAHVGLVFTCAMADELIRKNPMKSPVVVLPSPHKKRVVPWTAHMVAAVRSELPAPMQAMVDVGAGLGLRQGEIFGLGPDDIDWVSGIARIERQVKIVGGQLVFALPKGGKTREVPLPASVQAALKTHMKAFPAESVALPWREPGAAEEHTARLFFHLGGRALHRTRDVNPPWRAALERAGIVAPPLPGEKRKPAREHGMHALRHYFASTLLTEGEAVHAVAEWMGHHSPSVTWDIYAHLMPKSQDRMRTIIDRALKVPGRRTNAREMPDPAPR